MKRQIVLLIGILVIIFTGCDKESDFISPNDLKDSTKVETHSLLLIKNGINQVEFKYTDSTMITFIDFMTGEYKEYSYSNDRYSLDDIDTLDYFYSTKIEWIKN